MPVLKRFVRTGKSALRANIALLENNARVGRRLRAHFLIRASDQRYTHIPSITLNGDWESSYEFLFTAMLAIASGALQPERLAGLTPAVYSYLHRLC